MTGRALLKRGLTPSLVVALALASSSAPAASRHGPLVVFEFGGDLYAIAPTGGRTYRLTATKPGGLEPRVSPDGRAVVFVRGYEGGVSIMKINGSDKRIVTPRGDREPAWSPDGRTIYFSRSGYAGDRPAAWIFSVNASGGAVHRVVPDSTKAVECEKSPAVSPGGTRIAYTDWDACEGGTSSPRLRVVDLAGAPTPDLAKLRHNGFYPDPEHSGPAWSPDGRRLAFFRNATLTVANRDGSGEHGVVPYSLAGRFLSYDSPAWSPDGKWIAFTRDIHGTGMRLFVVHPDGTGLRLLHKARGDMQPSLAGWLTRGG